MKTGFVTDEFSTLSGLAAVAYGNVDLFREVQNQIIKSSPTKSFDIQRPSDIFKSFLVSEDYFLEVITNTLETQYDNTELFADYIDETLGIEWSARVKESFLNDLYKVIDSSSEHNKRLGDFITETLELTFPNYSNIEELKSSIVLTIESDPYISPDLTSLSKIISNNPHSKISTPPANTVIGLEQSTDLDKDFRGISFSTGYLTPQKYYSEIAYPGFENETSVPTTIKDSIADGYVGYLSNYSLEGLFNPIGSESIRDVSASIGNVLSPSSDIWNATSVLGQLDDIPGLYQSDKQIYEISLLGPRLNGLISYDPDTMSNGDFFKTSNLPDLLNSDKEDGVPFSSRNFSNVF